MDDKRIADYFVIAGLSDDCHVPFEEVISQDNVPKVSQSHLAPITDITVIIRSNGETVPNGYTCIDTTPFGFVADLNHGSLRSPSIFLCYNRSRDKPPLVDIGVLYEGKERIMSDSEIVHTTIGGRPANVNNSGSRTYLTFRRARDNAPCNQLVVTDICIILANKGESPPHAFCLINKNLNKGMVGSDVFICYKKSMNRPPLLCFKPSILDRYPLEDYPHFSLPESVPLFCFPMGATVESWPKPAQQPRPVFSTFVLTSDSAEKVYGAAITFYEKFAENRLNDDEMKHLLYKNDDNNESKYLHTIKSICILSRWPFFDTFERFLLFLHRTQLSSSSIPQKIPLERYISHFMLDVPFPSPQRPKILVQLGINTDETVLISQPPEYMPLPLNGASFAQMLRNLGPENCIHVLLFALTEQKILLHSLRPDVLTSVAEALITMIFPFHWQCPYIPLCPLGLCDVLHAPLPFIVGVDSRYFDNFEPPHDVACVDLDTNSIYLSEQKRPLNPKLLPKKPTRILKATLEKLFEKLKLQTKQMYSVQTKAKLSPHISDNLKAKKLERQIEIEIQEAFIRYMASLLRNFRSYLLPITSAPTIGATDPSSLFDLQGFLKSRDRNYHKFFMLLMSTQMFTRFIEERSFVTDKDTSLAFFDECSEKLEAMGIDIDSSMSLRLLEIDDATQSDRTVYIAPPEPLSSSQDVFAYQHFGPLNPNLYHSHPLITISRTGSFNHNEIGAFENSSLNVPASPISKRTKQEIRMAQKIARRHAELPLTWTKCLISYCYSLWFIHLPAYVIVMTSVKSKPLKVAYEVLLRMQSLSIHPPDEVCYRVLMLLCGLYSHPVLAVKVLYEMKQHGVTPNAITYGYYNKAVLECKWPSGDTTATLMWNKLRNVIFGVSQFRKYGQIRASRIKNHNNLPDDNVINEVLGIHDDPSGESLGSGGPSDGGYATATESGSGNSVTCDFPVAQCKCLKKDDVDFRESDAFRLRTKSIVRSSSSGINCVRDFDSPAGVLMTSHMINYSFDDMTLSESFVRKRHKSADHGTMMSKNECDCSPLPFVSRQKQSPYLRSYSFGNDAKILQKLRHGVLQELREEMEKKNDEKSKVNLNINSINGNDGKDIGKRISNNINLSENRQKIGTLERCDEEEEEEFINKDNDKQIHNDKCSKSANLQTNNSHFRRFYRESSVTSNKSSLSIDTNETSDANQSSESVNEKSKSNASSISGKSNDVMASLTPIKDAIANLEIFSPDGRVASTLRSSFRLASRLAKSASPMKLNITRSPTFHGSPQSTDKTNRFGSLFGRITPKKGQDYDLGTPLKPLSRSATLPPISPSKNLTQKEEINQENLSNSNEMLSDTETDDTSQNDLDVTDDPKNDLDLTDDTKGDNYLFGSPWASKLAANRHSEYVYSTIKSAASNVANRFSGFKSTLAASTSASNSPLKSNAVTGTNTSVALGVANVASGTASLLSQWASMVAEKFPANYVFDDDDCESTNSFDMRRSSVAASEDEMSERSREGSLGRNFTGFGVTSNLSPLYELLEKQYSTTLEPLSVSSKIALEIEMTSCSRCYTCLAILYDEEIMEGWSADDSNLNTQCPYCSDKFVPMLTVSIRDFRCDGSQESINAPSNDRSEMKINESDIKDDLLININDDVFKEDSPKSTSFTKERRDSKLVSPKPLEPITVPYLSPLVLRKEVENVLDHEGDLCLTKTEFLDDHPIIFWNLLWFFKRINLPTHLHGLCLTAASLNKMKNISENWKSCDYRNVYVWCKWDNEKLHDDIGKPMHQLWIESSSRSSLLHALVTDDHKISRNLMRQIISCIQCNDLTTPMKLLLTERHKNNKTNRTLSTKQHSIYRDLLFLAFVSLGRENIDHTAFDREYRRAFESMTPKEQSGLSPIDRPPSIGTIFCRRFFKELELRPQTVQQMSVLSSNNSLSTQ